MGTEKAIRLIYKAVNSSKSQGVRKLIAAAKQHNCRSEESKAKFERDLARIGAYVVTHEKELFDSLTPAKARRR